MKHEIISCTPVLLAEDMIVRHAPGDQRYLRLDGHWFYRRGPNWARVSPTRKPMLEKAWKAYQKAAVGSPG